MAVLGPIVEVATDLLAAFIPDLFHGRAIRSKSIGGDEPGCSIPFHRFLEKRKRSLLIPGFGDVTLQHLAFVIDGAPEVVLHAVDLHENLIQMPSPLRTLPHRMRSFLPDLRCEHRSETVPPMTHTFMTNIDAALMEQIFNVSQ